jgi:cbb3-type cytochrome oxidase maturation protein
MEALYLLIPLSVVAVFGAAWVFLRMSDQGQFEDMDGPAWSVLHDDDRPREATQPERNTPETGLTDNRNSAEGAYRNDTLGLDAAQDRGDRG